MANPSEPGPMPGRILGIYALALMDRMGPIYGYLISERVGQRTEGAWRPGPGAVYPALNRLTVRGLARSRVVGRRRVYSITPKGREVLARIRAQTASWTRPAPDLSVLWAEVAGVEDVGTFLLLRLRRALDAIDTALASLAVAGAARPGMRSLRADVLSELSARIDTLRRREALVVSIPTRRGRGGKS